MVGGTGTISAAVTALALKKGIELFILNRGSGGNYKGATYIKSDIRDIAATKEALKGMQFDSVVDWVCYTEEHAIADYEIFKDKAKQFIFISSASTYHKPIRNYLITDSTPQHNPYSLYARNKIICERYFLDKYYSEGFPITIIRPSHTYDNKHFPVSISVKNFWTVIDRIKNCKPMPIHGDGASLWTITHNTDFAKGLLGAAGNFKSIGEAYNITSDEALTWNNLMRIAAFEIGAEPNIVHITTDYLMKVLDEAEASLYGDKMESVIFDNTKIKQLVPDFVCTTPYQLGVRQVLEYYGAHPEEKIIDEAYNQKIDNLIEGYQSRLK
jgi:nucleoside-diphosphate-sugar epimerase